jgi:hypothetical protein
LHQATADFPRIQGAHPLQIIVIELNSHARHLNQLSEIYKTPVELEFIRIVLARCTGIPIWESNFANCTDEGVEWGEAEGFANEHLKRIGDLYGKGQAVPRIELSGKD